MDKLDASGTSLMGYVDASFQELMAVFGEPFNGDGYKVDAEWVLETPYGVATIYNYKDGINYNGPSGTPREQIRDWHIGGHSAKVVRFIHEKLGK